MRCLTQKRQGRFAFACTSTRTAAGAGRGLFGATRGNCAWPTPGDTTRGRRHGHAEPLNARTPCPAPVRPTPAHQAAVDVLVDPLAARKLEDLRLRQVRRGAEVVRVEVLQDREPHLLDPGLQRVGRPGRHLQLERPQLRRRRLLHPRVQPRLRLRQHLPDLPAGMMERPGYRPNAHPVAVRPPYDPVVVHRQHPRLLRWVPCRYPIGEVATVGPIYLPILIPRWVRFACRLPL